MSHRQQFANGASLRLFWGADATGRFRAMTYFDALDRQQQVNLSALWHRFLATGIIRPHERLERLEDGLLLCRTSIHRLVGFMDRRDVILIDAFSRRDFPGRRPRERLEESRRIRQEHLALEGATDALPA